MWLQKIDNVKLEKKEIPRPAGKPYRQVKKTGMLVLHTTEGGTTEGAFITLAGSRSAPHFIVGPDRVIQCRPIGTQGACLRGEANGLAEIQIEIVGFSKQKPYKLEEATENNLVKVLNWIHLNLGIPMEVPSQDWKDDLSDMNGEILATKKNSRRKSGVWTRQVKGVYYHLEVPENDHWDCGALNRTEILRKAKGEN